MPEPPHEYPGMRTTIWPPDEIDTTAKLRVSGMGVGRIAFIEIKLDNGGGATVYMTPDDFDTIAERMRLTAQWLREHESQPAPWATPTPQEQGEQKP